MTNVLDKVISWFSPSLALQRVRSRFASDQLLAYDAAKVGRRTDGWIAASSDANTELALALPRLRQRSHDLVRNNCHANKAILEIEKTSVGYGITPVPKTGSEALDNKIQELFTTWTSDCDADGLLDFYALQSLWARTIAESGSVLVRLRPRQVQDNLTVPLQLQPLET